MRELRSMLKSRQLGKFFLAGCRLAPVVALAGLLWPAAGCGGPGSTSVALFDWAGNALTSGAHLAAYPNEPRFPLHLISNVSVLRPEPSGSDSGGTIDPQQLRLALRTVAADSRDPAACSTEITAQMAQAAEIRLAIDSALGCVVKYTAQVVDTEQYNQPAPQCWSYRLESITHPDFSFVLAGYQQPCK